VIPRRRTFALAAANRIILPTLMLLLRGKPPARGHEPVSGLRDFASSQSQTPVALCALPLIAQD
ncbi:MAG: hypothetical protein WAM69_13695, partial [Candidatus Sulfotelmatobacter sp.]